MATVTKPIALDRSFNTTEQTSRNIADVLAEELSAIITALGGLNFINYEVVEELPTTGISTTTIYLVPSDDPQSGNTYDEYINLNGTVSGWEKIGSTAIDLSGYYTSAETDALLDEKVDKDSFDEQTATDEFTTINGGLLSSCKVSLSPNQDLHGYSEPWVGGANENKADFVDGYSISPSGEVVEFVGRCATVNPITIESNTTYYVKRFNTADAGKFIYAVYNGSTLVRRVANIDNNSVLDTSGGDKLYVCAYDGTIAELLPMVTKNTLPTAYSPYSNICPISGHTQVEVDVSDGQTTQEQITVNLGGTYYSGTLDMVSGVLTVDKAKLAINTSTIATISKSGLTSADIFTLALPSTYKLSANAILSHYPYINTENVNEVGKAWLGSSNTQLRIGFSAYGTTTLEDFKTWLDANNVEGCFELATPQSIQLTPQQVKALVRENHLSAPLEGQEITESKYKKMFTFDDVIAYIQSL